jgi:hypothetical protein
VNKLKRHLSVANVLSCIALFVALSATAVAATKLSAGQVKAVNIATGAVTNPKLKNLGVTSSKIANGTIVAGKLKNSAVTNPKIKKEAVTTTKLKKKAVTTNVLAPESVTTGKVASSLLTQLVRNVAYENASSASNSEANKTATVSCPSGKEAIGGGVRLEGELAEVAVTGSYPISNGTLRTGWEALAHETGPGQGGNWSVVAFVVCAEI